MYIIPGCQIDTLMPYLASLSVIFPVTPAVTLRDGDGDHHDTETVCSQPFQVFCYLIAPSRERLSGPEGKGGSRVKPAHPSRLYDSDAVCTQDLCARRHPTSDSVMAYREGAVPISWMEPWEDFRPASIWVLFSDYSVYRTCIVISAHVARLASQWGGAKALGPKPCSYAVLPVW